MGVLTWIVVGIIGGWLAGMAVKGSGFGLVGNMVIGIVGALLGGWVAGALFNIPNPVSGFNFTTIIVAFLGAVLLMFIVGMFKGK